MEKLYTHILYATDLGPQSYYIGARALQIAKLNQATLSMIHVIEPPMTHISDFAQRTKELDAALAQAKLNLNALCQQLCVPQATQIVCQGTPQDKIIEVALQNKCDLIMMGSHGVGGYTHVLGSTAQHIIASAHCDALIIQVAHLQDIIEKTTLVPGKFLWQSFTEINTKPAFDIQRKPQIGSEHGFGEFVKRGPHPSLRPSSSPYKGGTRKHGDEDESDDNK